MKSNIKKTIVAVSILVPLALALPAAAATPPSVDVTGSYVVNFNYLGNDYAHDVTLSQDSAGNLTGNGGSPAGGSHVYTWVIDSGSVSGANLSFTAHYTASADAVTPLTIMNATGTVATNGTISGTWSDNYQGGSRSGTWSTASGTASFINVITNVATNVSSSDATLNALNGGTAATGHSFWVSTSTFSTASPSIPSGVYSTPDLGAIAANTAFSAALSSITTSGVPSNLPAITPNTKYYFAAWSLVNGTWYPGQILSFTTASSTVSSSTPPTNMDQCKNDGWKSFTHPSYKNQGQCVSSVVSHK